MKVVFDTNVVASASFWRGAPFDCLAAWAQGRLVAVVSANLLAEHHETIEELRLDYPERKPVEWVGALTESAELVFPTDRATGATPDPDDEMILECALAVPTRPNTRSPPERAWPIIRRCSDMRSGCSPP